MAAILIANMIATLAVSSVNILLPELMVSMGASYDAAQWIAIAYVVALGPAILVGGSLCDAFGKSRLFLVGIGIFTCAACVCALAGSVATMALFRAAQGVGAGILVATNLALVREITPPDRLGWAVGLLGSFSAVGTAIGPVLGGVLADLVHWRAVFLVNLPLGIAAILLAWAFLPPSSGPRISASSLAWADAAVLLAALATMAVSLRLLGTASVTGSLIMAVASTGLFAALFLRPTRSIRLISMRLLRKPALRTDLATNAIVASVVMSSLIIGPFYLTAGLGLSIGTVGLVMAASPATVAITSYCTGRRLSPANARRASLAGLGLLCLGAIAMACLDRSLGVGGYVACLALTASGYGTFTSANNTSVMSDASSGDSGRVSGLLNLSRSIGLLVGTTLMGSVFERVTGIDAPQSLRPELAESGLNGVYTLAAILIAIAIALRLSNLCQFRKTKDQH